MNTLQHPVIGQEIMNQIITALTHTSEQTTIGQARQERQREAILHDDIPTFMEIPVAYKPEHLAGSNAVIVGFGYEGVTSLSPSRSAPPTISRPPSNSIYWRMGADKAPDAIRNYSIFYSHYHNRGYFPEIDPSLVLHDALQLRDYGDIVVVPEDTEETLRRCSEKVADVVKAGALPIILGGDHTTPYPVVRAILEHYPRNIGVVVFDAHVDFSYTPGEYWASNQWTAAVT